MIASTHLAHLDSGDALQAALPDHLPVPLVVMRPDGTILRANRAFALYHGREPSFFSGKDFVALFPNPANQETLRRVAETGRPAQVTAVPFEHPWLPDRGTTYWNWSIEPILGPDGRVEALLSTSVDVTELVRSERAIRNHEEQYRSIVEHSLQGIMVVGGPPVRILYANQRCAEMTGYSVEELLALPAEAFPSLIHPGDREMLFGRLGAHLAGRDVPSTGEYRWLLKSGEARVIRYFASSVQRGGVPCIQVAFLDITERKAAERKLRRMRARLARRVRELAALHSAGLKLRELQAPQWVAQAIVEVLEGMLQYEHGAVLLTDEATGGLIPFALSNPGGTAEAMEADRAHVISHQPPAGQGITRTVAATGQSVRVNDVQLDSRYYAMRDGIRSELCVPLRLGSRTLGVVNVESTRPNAYGPADQRLLETAAAQIAVAIENARLYEQQLRQAQLLRQKVAQRTAALSEAVRSLQEEAARRSRAEAELARSHHIVSALNRVSTRMEAGLDLQAVFDTLAAGLESEKLRPFGLLFDRPSGSLSVQYASVATEALDPYESAASLSLSRLTLPAYAWPFSEVIAQGRPVYSAEQGGIFQACFPGTPRREVEAQARLLGIEPGQPALYLPLATARQVVGVLAVFGPDLQEADLSAFSPLADQLASTLERLRLGREAAEVHVLRELNRLRSELIANVSHEIRTPLGLIDVLCTSLLAGDIALDAETQRSFLGEIKASTDRLAALVDDFLLLGRSEGGRLAPDWRQTDLAELARTAIRRMEREATGHRLFLRAPEMSYRAFVDAGQMESVLVNLLSNALKYSPNGGDIVVGLDRSGDELILSVTDQGIGIAQQEQERIFDRFYRVDSAVGRRAGGTGLGLSVCRFLVEGHGGRIWLASAPGKGSTFYVAVPLRPPRQEQAGGVS